MSLATELYQQTTRLNQVMSKIYCDQFRDTTKMVDGGENDRRGKV